MTVGSEQAVQVTMSDVVVGLPSGARHLVQLKAVSRQNERLKLDSCGLEVVGSEKILVANQDAIGLAHLPMALERGDTFALHLDPEELARVLRSQGFPVDQQLLAWVGDTLGARYKAGKPFSLTA